MSDHIDVAFDRLRGQQPPEPFAEPEAVRRRGRRRTYRQALAMAAATLAVIGAGVGWAAQYRPAHQSAHPAPTASTSAPEPTGSATPGPATPAPTDLSSIMLRAQDLGPGTWRERPPSEPFSGDLWHWGDLCSAYRSADYPSLRHQIAVDYTGYAAGQPDPYLFEDVHRYERGWGARAFDDVRRVLDTCAGSATPSVTPGGVAPSHYAIIDTGFAGDESLLIREEQWYYQGETLAPTPRTRLIAAVRVGDLVATVLLSPDLDQSYAHTVAVTAAARLGTG